MEDNLTTQLTEIEKAELEALEVVIKREMGSFMAVGNALFTIQTHGLYREGHRTFDDYCKAKWGMGRHYAHYLVNASKVATNLLTRVNMMPPCEIQPIHEKQIRPLAQLEPEQQCEVWEEAVRTAPKGKVVTYKLVKGLVAKLVDPKPPKPPKEPEEYSDAVGFAHVAISQLSRIRDKDPRRDEAINMVSDWVEKAKNKKIGRRK